MYQCAHWYDKYQPYRLVRYEIVFVGMDSSNVRKKKKPLNLINKLSNMVLELYNVRMELLNVKKEIKKSPNVTKKLLYVMLEL